MSEKAWLTGRGVSISMGLFPFVVRKWLSCCLACASCFSRSWTCLYNISDFRLNESTITKPYLIEDIRLLVSLVNWHLTFRLEHSEQLDVSVASHYGRYQ